MSGTVYKTKKKQKQKSLPSVRKQYKNAKIDSGDARPRQKNLVSAQKEGIGIGPGTYTRAVQNGNIVYNGTTLNDQGIQIPDPNQGLIMQGEYIQGLRGPYKDLGHDVRVGVPMIMEIIPGTGIFSRNRTVVNYQGDPGYLDAQNRLAEAYNINGGNIMIGDEEKPYLLPEVQIIYRKNGGIMKRLIPKHQIGKNIQYTRPDQKQNPVISALEKNPYIKVATRIWDLLKNRKINNSIQLPELVVEVDKSNPYSNERAGISTDNYSEYYNDYPLIVNGQRQPRYVRVRKQQEGGSLLDKSSEPSTYQRMQNVSNTLRDIWNNWLKENGTPVYPERTDINQTYFTDYLNGLRPNKDSSYQANRAKYAQYITNQYNRIEDRDGIVTWRPKY